MNRENYPALLAQVADKIGELIEKEGIDPERAADIGLEATDVIRFELGGTVQYMPKGTSYEQLKRDRDIFEKWDRMTPPELAKEYDLSVMQIYRIYKTIRRAEIDKRQPGLFQEAS